MAWGMKFRDAVLRPAPEVLKVTGTRSVDSWKRTFVVYKTPPGQH